MNCLLSAQLSLSGSGDGNPEQIQHLKNCDLCRRLSAEVARNDSVLVPAFLVQAPDGLADDILQECFKVDEKRSALSFKTISLAATSLAASIVIGIISVMLANKPLTPSGSHLVLAHVIEELGVLNIDGDLGDDRLRWELQDYGLSLKHSIGKIKWIGRCELPGGLGLHVVADSQEFGIITIIVPPLPSQEIEKVEEHGIAAWMITIDSVQVGLASNNPTQALGISRYIESAISESTLRNEA